MVKTTVGQESEMKKLTISALILGFAAFASAQGQAQPAQHGGNEVAAKLERICAPDPDKSAREAKFAEHLAKRLLLNDAQQAAFKEFQLAREKAVEAAKARLCANKPDLSSFEGHLALHQAFLEDRLEAVKAENPKLIAFYNSLNAEQKSKFERIREQMAEMRGH
jgi:hypothetical protein